MSEHPEPLVRRQFEEAVFAQYFLSTIKRTGRGGPLELAATADKTQAEFCAKKDDGSYADDTLNAAWWAWQKAAALYAHPVAAPPRELIDRMVNRFLSWPLPKTFAPDCGISFDGRKPDQWNPNKGWPIGTNLLTADEARAMFEFVLDGAHPVAAPDVERDAARYRWLRDQSANQYEHPIVVSQDAKRTPRYLGPLLGELLDAAVDAGVAEIPKPTMSMYASREAMEADISKDAAAIERPNPADHDTAKWIGLLERMPDDDVRVDLWLHIYASPRSMGIEDKFRVPDGWRTKDGNWFHEDRGQTKEIFGPYVTHWMPLPDPPQTADATAGSDRQDVDKPTTLNDWKGKNVTVPNSDQAGALSPDHEDAT